MKNSKALHIGVDIGGTNIKFGIISSGGVVLEKRKIKTNVSGGERAIQDSIVENIHAMLEETNIRIGDIGSIGIGVPGTVDPETGVVLFAPNIFWENVNIVKIIRRSFDVPVYAAQDTRAAAWAEYLVGTGKGVKNLACITIGTGIGCGLIVNGAIFNGGLNTAGEFGHQIIKKDGNKCNCGRNGCIEAYAGGLAIIKEAKRIMPDQGQGLDVHDIFNMAEAGDKRAYEIIRHMPGHIGAGIVNLLNLMSPEMVVLSGGISQASDRLLFDPLAEFVRKNAYVSIAGKVKICKSVLGDMAPLIGASLLHKNYVRGTEEEYLKQTGKDRIVTQFFSRLNGERCNMLR